MNNSLLKPFNQQYCLSVSGFCVTHGHNAVKNRITMQAADAASLVPYDPRKRSRSSMKSSRLSHARNTTDQIRKAAIVQSHIQTSALGCDGMYLFNESRQR